MIASVAFAGFKPELPRFLKDLGEHNTREWFQAHYDDYQHLLVEPARALVLALGERFPELGPGIHADPRVRGSIMAINRDVRFSRDKAPYKTHLDLWFWQGEGPSRERPGYLFRLTPAALMLGAGMHHFTDEALVRFRDAALDPHRGTSLDAAARAVGTQIGYQTLKRVPTGYPRDHPRAEWLRYTGLVAVHELPLPPQVYSGALVELCFDHYRQVAPLQQWLAEVLSA